MPDTSLLMCRPFPVAANYYPHYRYIVGTAKRVYTMASGQIDTARARALFLSYASKQIRIFARTFAATDARASLFLSPWGEREREIDVILMREQFPIP